MRTKLATIKDVRVKRGYEIGPDHYLVEIKFFFFFHYALMPF